MTSCSRALKTTWRSSRAAAAMVDNDTRWFLNPTGRFVEGGPKADAGLTGRKIIVDTYGGMGRHGGGAFSGKDPSKVDRSAAYAAAGSPRTWLPRATPTVVRCRSPMRSAWPSQSAFRCDLFGTGKVDDRQASTEIDAQSLRPAAGPAWSEYLGAQALRCSCPRPPTVTSAARTFSWEQSRPRRSAAAEARLKARPRNRPGGAGRPRLARRALHRSTRADRDSSGALLRPGQGCIPGQPCRRGDEPPASTPGRLPDPLSALQLAPGRHRAHRHRTRSESRRSM